MQTFRSLCRRLGLPVHLGRAGAIALVTAVAAPMLLMVVGFVADYGYASFINQRLARATDDATVGSVAQSVATAAGGYGNTTYLQNAGTRLFNANIAPLAISSGLTFNLTVVSDGSGGVIANGSYSYKVPTFFSGMLGMNNIPISGSARTTARPLVYVNYYILVDTSQSMGIASTPADMTKLYNLVVAAKNGSGGEVGCVFGCHVIGKDQTTALISNETLAHLNNVELRIDAAVTAVKSIISQAQTIAATAQNIKFGLYAIQENPNTHTLITTVATPSTNYAALLLAAASIDLGSNTMYGTGDSDFPNELSTFNANLTASGVTMNGTGASAASPLNYFLIVTDGLADVSPGAPDSHATNAFDPSSCTALKAKGTVGVVYTTYNPIYYPVNSTNLEGNYKNLVAPYVNQIAPNLQQCASNSNFYFEASDGPDIVNAMQTLFQRTQASSARITQ